jgi:hypothetical protein
MITKKENTGQTTKGLPREEKYHDFEKAPNNPFGNFPFCFLFFIRREQSNATKTAHTQHKARNFILSVGSPKTPSWFCDQHNVWRHCAQERRIANKYKPFFS